MSEEVKNNEEKITKPKENKFAKKIKKIIKKPIIISFFILLILLIIIITILAKNNLNHRETLISYEFKNVGELVTQEWRGTIIEDSKQDRKIFEKISIPFTESRVIFSLDVEVNASIDFSKIKTKEINDKTLKITLPRAKIYKCYQVPNTFKPYLEDESLFKDIKPSLLHSLEEDVVKKGKEMAISGGILKRAEDNAKQILEKTIKAQNKDINIIFEYE